MIKSPENRTVLEGNDITLFCEVGGSPFPNTSWYRNGKIQRNKIKKDAKGKRVL
jgi:hypothetical protein